eukprot:GEMP01008910.1.p1 GENE.GEMP01008910.1~~GEMP01008910.1.p1  ORF type:complete len:527 (+),score=77.44 GEMP01008910.1:84-1664(+)
MLTVLLTFPLMTSAQIRIASPSYLASRFNYTGVKGSIASSTATFGAPYYGERIMGTLKYAAPLNNDHPHCKREGYTDIEKFAASMNQSSSEEVEDSTKPKERFVIVVRRGGCTFVTKVRVAQELGASAVIVVDSKYSWIGPKTVQSMVMSADAYGTHIRIPSVFVCHQDGQRLIEGIESSSAPPMVEMSWDVPQSAVALVDLWMSSASREAYVFLKEFRPVAESLLYDMQFVPHFQIYSYGSDYNEECAYGATRFCAPDPDMGGPIKGKDVVAEDLRQLCLWEATAEGDPTSTKVTIHEKNKPSEKEVRHSKIYWAYVSIIHDRCRLDAKDPSKLFGNKGCSEAVMVEVGVSVSDVNKCIKDNGMTLLAMQLNNRAWGSYALRINSWRYKGPIETTLVKKAICSSYITPPEACTREELEGGSIRISWMSMAAIIVGTCLFLGICAYIGCTRIFPWYARQVVRDEVLLEVSSKMAEYRAFGEEDDDDDDESIDKKVGRSRRFANLNMFGRKKERVLQAVPEDHGLSV